MPGRGREGHSHKRPWVAPTISPSMDIQAEARLAAAAVVGLDPGA